LRIVGIAVASLQTERNDLALSTVGQVVFTREENIMAKTVIGLFDDISQARDVVQELVNRGIERNNISLIANNVENVPVTYDESDAVPNVGIGAVLGGIGGLLVGLSAFAIPGIGPVIGAGWLASTVGGGLIGGTAGGLIGALIDESVPDYRAGYYVEGVRRGGTLVAVKAADHEVNLVENIMLVHRAVEIDERGAFYRERGYKGYDPDALPYTRDELVREREIYHTMERGRTAKS
jgi:hypothetical protein